MPVRLSRVASTAAVCGTRCFTQEHLGRQQGDVDASQKRYGLGSFAALNPVIDQSGGAWSLVRPPKSLRLETRRPLIAPRSSRDRFVTRTALRVNKI